jgi:hypothetical protein
VTTASPACLLADWVPQDWTQEEFSRGCYMSVFGPGAIRVRPPPYRAVCSG